MVVVFRHSEHFFQQFFLDFFGVFAAIIEMHTMIQQVCMQQVMSKSLHVIEVR